MPFQASVTRGGEVYRLGWQEMQGLESHSGPGERKPRRDRSWRGFLFRRKSDQTWGQAAVASNRGARVSAAQSP
jgi:hypothetical protein